MINSKGVPVVVLVRHQQDRHASTRRRMAIKEYALPNAASRPRRLALESDDIVWYTDFPRGYLGRLDLADRQVKEWPSPSGPKSEPYGIVFTKGAVWYNESGAKPNTIVRFDPKTEKFQSWAIPGGGDIVRNMDVTPRRQSGHRQQPHQPGRTGRDPVGTGGAGARAVHARIALLAQARLVPGHQGVHAPSSTGYGRA